jgi:NADH-quinone oxidoreductase subunit N
MASVVVGSFAALKQKKLKRLLAYSSISHVGYLLLAFAANSIEGTQALFFYLSIYMITSLTLWTFILSIESTTNLNRSKTLVDLSNVVTANPLLALTGLLAFFSLAGVPPLAGFYAKMQIFIHTMGSSFFFASFFAILTSVISSYYYIRVIKNIYFEGLINKTPADVYYYPVTRASSLMLGSGLLFLIFLFLNPTMLLLFTEKMALSLF